jgi:hypothetical protein
VSGLLGRVGAIFFEPAEPSARSPHPPVPAPERPALRAAVLGAPSSVVPLAAACAGELRARSGAAAALVCIWRPPNPAPVEREPEGPAARSPAGATTPGARRLATRLVARDLMATACGRLAWLALDPDPAEAAGEFRRSIAAAGGPVVLAVAGARPAPFEPLLADLDLCIAVLPPDVDPELAALALDGLGARAHVVVAPLAAGPARWAAMAGLARLRSLHGAAR